MRRLLAVGTALGLVWFAQPGVAQASPRHSDAGAIVYVSDRDSTSADDPIDEIYAISPRTREVVRLTHDLPGVERYPTVSPDGRSLAWVRWEFDAAGVPRQDLAEIHRCDLRRKAGLLSCHNPRKVLGPVYESRIAWTPDSRSLVYPGPPNADGDVDLYRVRLRDGQTQNLTNEAALDGTSVVDLWPAVSPDGRQLVYARGSVGPTAADLYRRNIDGSNPMQLTAAPFNDVAADYSPDGKRLVFHSTRDGDADIYIMRAAAEGPRNPAVNLTDALDPTDGLAASQERTPTFSPNGRHIAFWWFTRPATGYSAGFTDGEIYRMRTDGSHVRNLTDNNPTDPSAPSVGDIQPAWGPAAVGRGRG